MGIFDFEPQFIGYAEYHNNKINQAIHMVFVPTIMWTTLVWLHNLQPLIPTWPLQDLYTPLNVGLILTIIYATYYVVLKPQIGLPAIPLLLAMNYSAYWFLQNNLTNPDLNPNVIATFIHILSWICQFLGHGLAEKRRPALMDNLLHALVLAPFFVWTETLFGLGFFKELSTDLQAKVDKKVAAFRASQAKKGQ
jgi:uncharacterized membrane protein YGL010W